ncbi:von Willebrand factor-like [Hemitrygon akajei]|uniref:von Willebrand factor-like n=1 Tax=Hemitrygon akajei TaxID=2704970 RepID=UPI003BF9F425
MTRKNVTLQEQAIEGKRDVVDLLRKSNSTGEEFIRVEGEKEQQCIVTGIGNTYVSTFRESQFEFRGHCMYMLLTELKTPSAFSIVIDQQEDCLKGKCTRNIIISKGNLPRLELINMTQFIQQHGQSFPISYSGMSIYGTQEELLIEINKHLTVHWNGKGTVIVSLKKQKDLAGLCCYSSDVLGQTAAAMWELKMNGRSCVTKFAEDQQLCQASVNCLDKGDYGQCSLKTLSILQRACKNDACWGNEICSSRLTLLRQCATGGFENHITAETKHCFPECRPSHYFSYNISICPKTCQTYWNNAQCKGPALMGCVCPDGLVSYHGKCIQPEDCPCSYDGQVFESGKSVQLHCFKCDCNAGQLECSESDCPVVCSVTGSQYITTFDGLQYYFYGGCVHILVKADAFVIYIGTNTCQKSKFCCTERSQVEARHPSTALNNKSSSSLST